MIREVDLIGYLPLFVQEYREIEQIMNTENPEFQLTADESEIIKDNQFIQTANESGIKRFEDLLNIKALDDDTLENRKFRVMTKWNNSLPYTEEILRERLTILCGEDGYTLTILNLDYTLVVRVALTSRRNYIQVENMLKEIVPCNMIIDLSLLYNQHETLGLYTHEQLSSHTQYELRNEVLA